MQKQFKLEITSRAFFICSGSSQFLPMLLKFNKCRFAGWVPHTVHIIFWCVRRVGSVHYRMRCSRRALIGAPQVREVQRVCALRGHFPWKINHNFCIVVWILKFLNFTTFYFYFKRTQQINLFFLLLLILFRLFNFFFLSPFKINTFNT